MLGVLPEAFGDGDDPLAYFGGLGGLLLLLSAGPLNLLGWPTAFAGSLAWLVYVCGLFVGRFGVRHWVLHGVGSTAWFVAGFFAMASVWV